ncbi:MAG: ankyrin repeat domain-containing protein [Sedimentisphaerales bacterium]|nr:ankyrin repeat domain-containing protein [Sedimentisphaerales bacterium]
MKNQRKNHSILKVILISVCLIVFLEPSILSAQNTEPQQYVQVEQGQEELTQALFTAVTNGRGDEVKKLIAQGAAVNAVDKYGRTPLHSAASAGHIDIVKLLIAQGARLDIKDNAGRVPLHYASGAGSSSEGESQANMLNIIQLLLDNNTDINARDNSGFSPLYYAAERRHKDIVELLINSGADIDIVDNRGHTAYLWLQNKISVLKIRLQEPTAQVRINGYQEIAKLLKRSVYYVATNGGNDNPGTLKSPFSSITFAIEIAEPGDTIIVRGGTYVCTQTVHIDKSGLSGKPILIKAFPGEVPVFDCSTVNTLYSTESDVGFMVKGAYWHIQGIVITDVHRGLSLGGEGAHHNVVEQVIGQNADIAIYSGAAQNLILDCDAYQNVEFLRNGGNADGFLGVYSLGEGNILIGNRSWNNSDDGFDVWFAGNSVRFEKCYAWDNGVNIWNHPFFAGDGNGFKLGQGQGKHILINCVAWGNPHRGFDLNANRQGVVLYNCTGWNNLINYYFTTNSGGAGNVLRNNLSYGGQDSIGVRVDSQSNSWDAEVGIALADSDFLSLDYSMMSAPRNPDGSIPQNNFLKLAPASSAIDKGVDVGMPFVGKKPDLGAFEHDPNGTSHGYVKMLHQYVRDHNIEKINEMLEAGTDINEKDWLGYAPLHWACYFGFADLVTLLIDKGADVNKISDTGRTCLEIADAMDYKELVELLKKHGAKE